MFLKYLTTPWKARGRTFQGADCYGLVMLYFANELGIKVRDFVGNVDESGTPTDLCIHPANYDDWLAVEVEDIKPNDILLLRNGEGHSHHVGIVVDTRHFLHTLEGMGPAVSKIMVWRNRIVGAYRHRGLVE